jgi:hypothetical protein
MNELMIKIIPFMNMWCWLFTFLFIVIILKILSYKDNP